MKPVEFAEKLAKIKRDQGLRNSDIAYACKVSERTVQRWLSGVGGPWPNAQRSVFRALGYDHAEKASPLKLYEIAAQIEDQQAGVLPSNWRELDPLIRQVVHAQLDIAYDAVKQAEKALRRAGAA